MNNEISKAGANLNNNTEFRNIDEMVSGCDEAMVTMALNDRGKLCKVVILYSSENFDSEMVGIGVASIIKRSKGICVFKKFVYSIYGIAVKRLKINYWAVLLKDFPGFIPGPFTHDCRTKYENV